MRKSNWIILGLLAVACAVLLWLYYNLQFNLVDSPFDLVLAILWWAVIAVACALIARQEANRRRAMRTCYVSAMELFNPEAGHVALDAATNIVPVIQKTLISLKYPMQGASMPSEEAARAYIWVIETQKFTHEGQTWSGNVYKVSKVQGGEGRSGALQFASREELSRILGSAV